MMRNLSTTEDRILDSALELFLRYGLAKTSMSDIAQSSSLSRTALYNHFATKEGVFKKLSERINLNVRNGVIRAIQSDGPWSDRLQSALEARLIWVFELLNSPPHGRELIDEKNKLCGGDVLATNDAFFGYIEKLCRERSESDASARRMARVLVRSLNGIMDSAETQEEARQDMRQLIEYLADATKKMND